MKTRRGPDDVRARFGKNGILKVVLLPADEDAGDFVLLEGNKAAYEYLGRLFLAHAKAHDCGFQISPNGAGSALFKILRWVSTCTAFPATKSGGAHDSHIPRTSFIRRYPADRRWGVAFVCQLLNDCTIIRQPESLSLEVMSPQLQKLRRKK